MSLFKIEKKLLKKDKIFCQNEKYLYLCIIKQNTKQTNKKLKIMKTLKQLKENTNVRHANGYNSYDVEITYRGKSYRCKSNNSLAWDRLDGKELSDRAECYGYTNKGAWQSFYDECKRANNLGEYNY